MAIEYLTQTNATSNTHGTLAQQAAREMRSVRDKLRGLQKLTQAMVDDPAAPTDFTLLETSFGLAAGAGTKMFTLIKDAFAAIDVSNVSKFTDRVG